MADPLSVTAAFVGIIGATGQGVGLLFNTIQNIRNDPESIKAIQTGLQQLRPLLAKLEFTIKEDPTELILSTEIKDALENCNQACTNFSVSLTRWTRHSVHQKTSLFDKAKIGVFRQGEIRLLNKQLGQSIKILNVTLDTATFIRMSRQEDTVKQLGEQMLVLRDTINEPRDDKTALTKLEEPVLPLADDQGNRAVLEEMKRPKAMIDAVESTSQEELKAATSQRTKQKIYDVKTSNDGVALTGFINVGDGEVTRDQDISKISADGRGISIAGVANNIDINAMFARMRP